MPEMESGFLMRLLSSWEIVLVCIGLIVLMPVAFYLASLKPARRAPAPRNVKKKAPAARTPPAEGTAPAGGAEAESENEADASEQETGAKSRR